MVDMRHMYIVAIAAMASAAFLLARARGAKAQRTTIARVFPKKALKEAAARAVAKLPDRIHMVRRDDYVWKDATGVAALVEAFTSLGFAATGVYATEEMPQVMTYFLLNREEKAYAVIYEHEKLGIWSNIIYRCTDGSSATFATSPERGLDRDPRHALVHMPGADPAALFQRAVAGRPQGVLKDLSETEIVTEFENAFEEQRQWRNEHPISAVAALKAGLSVAKPGSKRTQIKFFPIPDGEPEVALKKELTNVFVLDFKIERAYFALVQYSADAAPNHALCLVSEGKKDVESIKKIDSIFHRTFAPGNTMDIMFVGQNLERILERACPPFYVHRGS
jgi:hypothetical protein